MILMPSDPIGKRVRMNQDYFLAKKGMIGTVVDTQGTFYTVNFERDRIIDAVPVGYWAPTECLDLLVSNKT